MTDGSLAEDLAISAVHKPVLVPDPAAPPAGAADRRGARPWSPVRLRANRRFVVIVSLLVTFGIWEMIGRDSNPVLFAPVSRVAEDGWEIGRTGEFWSAAWSTAYGILLGFTIAAVAGVTIGLLSGRYRAIDWATSAQITYLYVTPHIVFIPLFMLWFGLGFTVKLAIVIMGAIFPILITTHDGAKITSEEAVDVARVEGASELQILSKIVLPGTLPYIMTGMRLGIGKAMTGMIAAELFTQLSGLGGLILIYTSSFRSASMLFVIFMIGVFGWGLTAMMGLAERRFARWKFPDAA